jgi:Mrp family chromosome partitioning ATPase
MSRQLSVADLSNLGKGQAFKALFGGDMAGNKSPKTIATINFKGGVGKTTVTWCLADTLATYSNASVLMFDLDAQMSLRPLA